MGSTIRQEVANAWKMPRDFVSLIQNDHVAKDDETVDMYSQDGTLSLTALFSHEHILANFECPGRGQQALTSLIRMKNLGPEAGDAAFCAISTWFNDPDPKRRSLAIHVLPSIVKKGCREALEVAAAHLDDAEVDIRKKAISALVEIAEVGDDFAVKSLIRCIECCNQLHSEHAIQIKYDAVHGLGQLAEKGTREAIEAVCGCLTDGDEDLRIAALVVL